LNDEELPLPMCLSWTDEGMEGLAKNKFVLQENDTGEILWDAFSLPELESFLMILNREEEEYLKEMKSTYRLLKIQLQKRFKELKRDRIEQQDNNNSQDEHL
jgi:Ras association domain-containing protein 1